MKDLPDTQPRIKIVASDMCGGDGNIPKEYFPCRILLCPKGAAEF